LREDEHWPILTHHDRADLKPGEYLLTSTPPARPAVTFSRPISAKLRAEVLDRNGFTCQMCGLCPGILIQARAGKSGSTLATSKTKALAEKMNCQIFVRFAQAAIKGPRTSPAKNRRQFGCSAKSGGPELTNKRRCMTGLLKNS
jgi:hypothetical protein